MTYFLRITYANFLYALAQRLRGPVVAWRIELPAFLARPFGMVRPYELFDRDEWILLHDTCFDVWRDRLLPAVMVGHRCRGRSGGADVDYSRNVWQILAKEFEHFYLFVATVQRASPASAPRIVTPWIAIAIGLVALRAELPHVALHKSWLNDLGERLCEWGLSAAHLARTALQFALSFTLSRIDVGPRRILWAGISPQEVPDGAQKLHFGWAAAYGHIVPRDVLYFLPAKPNAAQSCFLASENITTVEPYDLFRLLPVSDRVRVIFLGWCAILRGLFLDSATIGPLRARFMARSPLWQALARRLQSDTYITSGTASWPERPEVAAFNADGLRTVIWSYSANTLWFAKNTPSLRDVGVLRSIVISDEFWVWNEAVQDYYRSRRASDGIPFPRIVITGPMMCGDVTHLDLSPREARRRLGLPEDGYCISVFDIPTVDEAWRHQFSYGPIAIEMDFAEAFFDGIRRLLEDHPELRMLFKLKREVGTRYRRFPSSMLELLAPNGKWLREGRILTVDVNCDPYLPIAAGDASLAMPCTSPVLVALATGRPAAYYDPLGILSHSPAAALVTLGLRSEAALGNAVKSWMAGSQTTSAPPTLVQPPAWRKDAHLFLPC